MTKQKSEPKSTGDSKGSWRSEWPFWKPLMVMTSIYCIAAFLLTAAAYSVNEDWFLLPVVAIVFSQSQITSMFAALGPSGYWKRLAVTQGCSFLVLLSILGGLLITYEESPHEVIRGGITGVFVIGSVTTQLVYGILRLALGWRLHKKDTERGPAYSLKDLFALTMFLGIALSILSGWDLMQTQSGQVSPESIAIMVTFLMGTVFYGLPTLWTTFRLPRESEQGCFAQPIIIIFIGFFVILPFVAMGAPSEVVGPLVICLCSCSLFTALPLSQMRGQGFVLSDGKE